MKNKSLATCYSVIFVLVITGIILSLLECDKAQYDVDKQLLLPSEVTYKMLWWQRNTGKFTFYQSDDCWAFDKKSCCQKMDINFDKSTISAQKRPLIIALLDTGIDIQHQALQNNIFYNSQEIPNDNLDNDNNGFIDDLHGWNFLDNNANVNSAYDSNNPCSFHGTHIAGIISASENSCAMSGLLSNYNVKLLCVKILDDELNGTLENLKKAIIYSEKMGASICCLSIGTDTYDSDLRNLMCKSKMLFVTAAGNGFIDIDKNPFYPASYKLNNQISVASIRCDGRLSATSNYGKDTIDVAAPGLMSLLSFHNILTVLNCRVFSLT